MENGEFPVNEWDTMYILPRRWAPLRRKGDEQLSLFRSLKWKPHELTILGINGNANMQESFERVKEQSQGSIGEVS